MTVPQLPRRKKMSTEKLFDKWPQRYDQWFQTPAGKRVKEYETEVILELLKSAHGESILDAGCGTGIFTLDFLAAGARVVGLEISLPMLAGASEKTSGYPFEKVQGDMLDLPFENDGFDKVVSVTALEFIADAAGAVNELFRVAKPGGRIVVATLNSLSPWGARRKAKTESGERHILENAFFRSPNELRALMPYPCVIKTAIHFNKDDDPARIRKIERKGRSEELETGAFVAALWQKPAMDP